MNIFFLHLPFEPTFKPSAGFGRLRQVLKLVLFFSLTSCTHKHADPLSSVIHRNPWLKPFAISAICAKESQTTQSIRAYNLIDLRYPEGFIIGPSLYGRIDSAAAMEGWEITKVYANAKFLDHKIYWKNWHGQSDIRGEYNIILTPCGGSLAIQWMKTPSDTVIRRMLQTLHADQRKNSWDGSQVEIDIYALGHEIVKYPKSHPLFGLISEELKTVQWNDTLRSGRRAARCIIQDEQIPGAIDLAKQPEAAPRQQ
jgi:hypothetical protein